MPQHTFTPNAPKIVNWPMIILIGFGVIIILGVILFYAFDINENDISNKNNAERSSSVLDPYLKDYGEEEVVSGLGNENVVFEGNLNETTNGNNNQNNNQNNDPAPYTGPLTLSVVATPDIISHPVGYPVTITATAQGGAGVTQIKIYLNNAPLKTCSSSPCVFVTNNGSGTPDTYSYYAVATDTTGATVTSPTKTYLVGVYAQSAPVLTVSHSPAGNAIPAPVTITASATDLNGIARITIFVDGYDTFSCSFGLIPNATCSHTWSNFGLGGNHYYFAQATGFYYSGWGTNNNPVDSKITYFNITALSPRTPKNYTIDSTGPPRATISIGGQTATLFESETKSIVVNGETYKVMLFPPINKFYDNPTARFGVIYSDAPGDWFNTGNLAVGEIATAPPVPDSSICPHGLYLPITNVGSGCISEKSAASHPALTLVRLDGIPVGAGVNVRSYIIPIRDTSGFQIQCSMDGQVGVVREYNGSVESSCCAGLEHVDNVPVRTLNGGGGTATMCLTPCVNGTYRQRDGTCASTLPANCIPAGGAVLNLTRYQHPIDICCPGATFFGMRYDSPEKVSGVRICTQLCTQGQYRQYDGTCGNV